MDVFVNPQTPEVISGIGPLWNKFCQEHGIPLPPDIPRGNPRSSSLGNLAVLRPVTIPHLDAVENGPTTPGQSNLPIASGFDSFLRQL